MSKRPGYNTIKRFNGKKNKIAVLRHHQPLLVLIFKMSTKMAVPRHHRPVFKLINDFHSISSWKLEQVCVELSKVNECVLLEA